MSTARALARLAPGLLLLALGARHAAAHGTADADFERRIRFYSEKVARHPNLAVAHARLGAAYLDKARDDRDVRWLDRACLALGRSLEIQPNFEAFEAMAAASNFMHDFDAAVRWAHRAARIHPGDTEIKALLMEAYLASGRHREASELLDLDTPAVDFYDAAARGLWWTSRHRHANARRAFDDAARFAAAAGETRGVVWARVRAAGALIDAGRAEDAATLLDTAAALDPHDVLLGLYRARLAEARDQLERALELYESWLDDHASAEDRLRAAAIADRLGLDDRALDHHGRAVEASAIDWRTPACTGLKPPSG